MTLVLSSTLHAENFPVRTAKIAEPEVEFCFSVLINVTKKTNQDHISHYKNEHYSSTFGSSLFMDLLPALFMSFN